MGPWLLLCAAIVRISLFTGSHPLSDTLSFCCHGVAHLIKFPVGQLILFTPQASLEFHV